MSGKPWLSLHVWGCQELTEGLSTGEDLSFLNFPVGGTGCPFLRQDLAHVSRSFLLSWMVSPQKPSYLPVKDRDREPGLGGQLGEAGKASLPSACVCSLSARVCGRAFASFQPCLLPQPTALLLLHKLTCSLQRWGRWPRGRIFSPTAYKPPYLF